MWRGIRNTCIQSRTSKNWTTPQRIWSWHVQFRHHIPHRCKMFLFLIWSQLHCPMCYDIFDNPFPPISLVTLSFTRRSCSRFSLPFIVKTLVWFIHSDASQLWRTDSYGPQPPLQMILMINSEVTQRFPRLSRFPHFAFLFSDSSSENVCANVASFLMLRSLYCCIR